MASGKEFSVAIYGWGSKELWSLKHEEKCHLFNNLQFIHITCWRWLAFKFLIISCKINSTGVIHGLLWCEVIV